MENIDTLCLCSGGMKGIVYFGILSYLETNKFINLNNIHTYAGSSVGGLIGFLFSIGYSVNEMIDFTLNFNFASIQTELNCEDIFTNYGICSNHKIVIILEHFLKHKYNIIDITFIDLYKLTGKKLVIIGTNISDSCYEVFDYNNTPDMSVMLALKITSCIPVLFEPILYKNKYYVDGGIGNAFPINYCNINTTLGLYVITRNRKIDSIKNVMLSCITILQNVPYKERIEYNNVIKIENIDINFDEFDASKERKQELIDRGINIANDYINNFKKKEKELVSITPNGIELKLNIDI
jgi:predicted patatin/cPLA2 family phospholipase